MKSLSLIALMLFSSLAFTDVAPLKLGIGLFQPDKEKNDATYKPLADYLAKELKRPVELKTVDTWEGLAKSLANGETDVALMGPWGYVLANNDAKAEAIATILYDGKPEYFAIMVTHPNSGITKPEQLKGKSFAFGDKGSTSGYLIPFYYFMKNFKVTEPETFFSKVLYTKHQAIETQVTAGELDAGADYNRNRNAMIESGLIDPKKSVIIWTSEPLPNDAVGVSSEIFKDKKLVASIQKALLSVGDALKANPNLLPAHYTGFVKKDNSFYKPIKDAGLATGKLAPPAK
ncbi:MAG: phosphate/phosphite/phosphonate ABC transporter substrate-binding protein [Rhizobacter sp.]|nr:phosphate/phosphite/phosphonate ABC transporter substrate-binding protein [Bacteriovorax sp.]